MKQAGNRKGQIVQTRVDNGLALASLALRTGRLTAAAEEARTARLELGEEKGGWYETATRQDIFLTRLAGKGYLHKMRLTLGYRKTGQSKAVFLPTEKGLALLAGFCRLYRETPVRSDAKRGEGALVPDTDGGGGILSAMTLKEAYFLIGISRGYATAAELAEQTEILLGFCGERDSYVFDRERQAAQVFFRKYGKAGLVEKDAEGRGARKLTPEGKEAAASLLKLLRPFSPKNRAAR